MLTLTIYDISDDGRRTALSKLLQNYGLRRVQYSGFLGDLNPNDREILAKEVGGFVEGETDSVYIIPLCDRDAKTCRIVSKNKVSIIDKDNVTIVS
ncbi:MAG: CRISPR-associated endonuclease Cas2 [Thaumarchaeota archaeon]|nr:CRISPR-associated endonuclease Cas2 [Nitrososphaerota archaeon]MCL5319167.1 CRISPR-associated endonuclease Cas2 [Nitrososphaerota archaeon]